MAGDASHTMLRAVPACPSTGTPALFANIVVFQHLFSKFLVILLCCLLPVHSLPSPDSSDLRPLHAALQLDGHERESELQRVMSQLHRSSCALVLQAPALTRPPSHTVHMHAAFCSDAPAAAAHFSAALALQPANVDSLLAAAYHPSMSHYSHDLLFRFIARLVPAPLRTGRQLYALAIGAAARGRFHVSSRYFALAVARGLALRDVGDSWAAALCDGAQPLRALQLLVMAGCCDGLEQGAEAEWCAASAVHVAEVLVVHGMAKHALLLLRCGDRDGGVQPDVMSLSCSARAHRSLGDLAAAAALFQQALQLQPDSTDARRNVGMILQEAGLLQQAEVHLRQCLLAEPSDATAMSTLATVCAKTGRVTEAEALFLAAAQLQPDNDSIRTNVATFYRNNKMWLQAQDFATRVLSRDAGACDMHAQLLQVHAQQSSPLLALQASASYVACCSTGSAACPDLLSARLSDVFFRRQLCDWSRFDDDVQLLQYAATSKTFHSSSFSAIQASVFPLQPAHIRAFAARQAADVERVMPLVVQVAAAAAPQRPPTHAHALRVGFSFSDWFDHPVGDDALAAVAAAAALPPSATAPRLFCISPSVPLRSQVVNSSHPCLQPPVESLFIAENSTEVT